jgi:hypothetical protein
VEARALERHLPRTTPLPTLLLRRTRRNTWKKLTGRPSANVENASVDEVVREPRVAPTSSRQPLLQSRDVLSEPHVVNGQTQFPRNDNRPNLSLPREQRRAEVDNRRAAPNGTRPTRWDQPPVQTPTRSPLRRGTRRSPERTLDNGRRRQRTPSPVDCRARPDDAKLLGFVATALELIKERVLHQLIKVYGYRNLGAIVCKLA